jgi:SAM-dependent methyltransferase
MVRALDQDCSAHKINLCPVCEHREMKIFWEGRDLPIHCHLLNSSREAALEVPRGNIVLGFCPACGMITNTSFDPGKMNYAGEYENALDFSSQFRQYIESLAWDLIERYELRGKRIIEIACGKGEFLKLLCELGNNTGIGFDPSGPAGEYCDGRVKIVRSYYDERYADKQVDFICCRQALEHMPDPVGFLRLVRRNLGQQRGTVLFFEVPNVMFTIRELGIWDIIYEHCNYFCAASLKQCFKKAGFEVLRIRETYGGQFLCIAAKPVDCNEYDNRKAKPDLGPMVHDVQAYSRRFQEKVALWNATLRQISESRRTAVVWGSGSKGVTFLNMLEGRNIINYVVDINPRKQGKFVTGSGQEIIPPGRLRDIRPNLVIAMNPLYMEEIRGQIKEIGLSAEIACA